MVGLTKQLAAIAAILTLTQAHPLQYDHQFPTPTFPNAPNLTPSRPLTLRSPDPSYLIKRRLYNLDDVADQSQKDKLTQGLKDAVTVASRTLSLMDDDAHRDKLEGWFGAENSDDNARELIRQVFKNFVGDTGDETGADVNGNVLVSDTDYWIPTPEQIGGPADGTTPFCDLETSDGKKGTAYYKTRNKKPGMHFCDKVWDREDLAGLTADGCSGLGNLMNTPRMTKNFIGANVLHEFMWVVSFFLVPSVSKVWRRRLTLGFPGTIQESAKKRSASRLPITNTMPTSAVRWRSAITKTTGGRLLRTRTHMCGMPWYVVPGLHPWFLGRAADTFRSTLLLKISAAIHSRTRATSATMMNRTRSGLTPTLSPMILAMAPVIATRVAVLLSLQLAVPMGRVKRG